MAKRRHYKTGKFVKKTVFDARAGMTHKERQAYRAGYQAGYDAAVDDIRFGEI